jgi:hypothetical protein
LHLSAHYKIPSYKSSFWLSPSKPFLCAEEDGGGLDVLVVSQASLQPGSYARVKVIGIMKMIDSGEQDDKIVAVAADDPMFRDVASLEELGEQRVGEIQRFFEDYKKGEEGKFVEVNGFEGAKEAQKAAKDALVSVLRDQLGGTHLWPVESNKEELLVSLDFFQTHENKI